MVPSLTAQVSRLASGSQDTARLSDGRVPAVHAAAAMGNVAVLRLLLQVVYVCMHACMYVCMHAYMYVFGPAFAPACTTFQLNNGGIDVVSLFPFVYSCQPLKLPSRTSRLYICETALARRRCTVLLRYARCSCSRNYYCCCCDLCFILFKSLTSIAARTGPVVPYLAGMRCPAVIPDRYRGAADAACRAGRPHRAGPPAGRDLRSRRAGPYWLAFLVLSF